MQKSVEPAQTSGSSSVAADSGALVIGAIDKITPDGVSVSYRTADGYQCVQAISTIAIEPQHEGRDCVLSFTQTTPQQAVILGLVYSPVHELLSQAETQAPGELQEALDDEGVKVIESDKELVFKCGESSLTLYRNGKIELRGTHVVSRSTGVNRILGASVQVN